VENLCPLWKIQEKQPTICIEQKKIFGKTPDEKTTTINKVKRTSYKLKSLLAARDFSPLHTILKSANLIFACIPLQYFHLFQRNNYANMLNYFYKQNGCHL